MAKKLEVAFAVRALVQFEMLEGETKEQALDRFKNSDEMPTDDLIDVVSLAIGEAGNDAIDILDAEVLDEE